MFDWCAFACACAHVCMRVCLFGCIVCCGFCSLFSPFFLRVFAHEHTTWPYQSTVWTAALCLLLRDRKASSSRPLCALCWSRSQLPIQFFGHVFVLFIDNNDDDNWLPLFGTKIEIAATAQRFRAHPLVFCLHILAPNRTRYRTLTRQISGNKHFRLCVIN